MDGLAQVQSGFATKQTNKKFKSSTNQIFCSNTNEIHCLLPHKVFAYLNIIFKKLFIDRTISSLDEAT